MRKLFSLLLCLALFLPVMAMAEAEVTPELYPLDLGDFTIGLYDGDYYEVAPEKVSNEVFAMIYPAYDETESFHDNINIIWSTEDASDTIRLLGAKAYGNMLVKATKAQFESQGVKVSDAQLLNAVYEDGVASFITSTTLDYSSTGADLIVTIFQLQSYIPYEEGSSYIFTFTASTLEDLEAITSYLNNIEDN